MAFILSVFSTIIDPLAAVWLTSQPPPMKSTLLSLLIFIFSVPLARAGAELPPDGVVQAALAAVQQDRLAQFLRCCDLEKIAAQPRHGMTAEALVALLKPLKLTEVRLEAPASDKPGRATVRMTAPLRMDFDLAAESQPPQGAGTPPQWRIIAVHP